ncbi:hypothetical protein ACROYT_G005656 [Oculina patagonica]
MYSSVPPPEQANSGIESDSDKEKEGPPRGISEETWQKFQQLRERRINCCKVSTEKRIKDIKKKATKSVLDNLRSDEDVAVLRDEGLTQQGGNKCKPNKSSHQLEKDKARKGYEKRWNELQHYFNSDSHLKEAETSSDYSGPTAKDVIEEKMEVALKEKRFEVAEKLNKQLMQHDFAVKVAQAVECRDYAKRKAADEEKAKKRKRSKPHWAFEQKARWESKGNM